MKNIKMFLFLLLSLSILFACSNNNSSQSNNDENIDEMEITLGHHVNEEHMLHKFSEKFAEALEEETEGKITTNILSNGQLGEQKDVIDGLNLGTVDITVVDSPVLANFYKPLTILDLPYVFKTMDHSINALEGELGNELKAGIEKKDLKLMSVFPSAYRTVVLTESSVDNPDDFNFEDLEGRKIRVLDSPIMVETFKSFDTEPTTIPSGEAYTSMQTNTVDGMESTPEFFNSIHIEEVGKYMVDTQHALVTQSFVMSADKFNELSDVEKKAFEVASDKATEWYNEEIPAIDGESRDIMLENDMEIIDIDLDKAAEAVSSNVEDYIDENEFEDLLEMIKDSDSGDE